MGKISDYTRVLAAKLADVFVVDQTDNGTTETKSATVEQIGTAIGTLQNFADLDTSNKNLVDAINEIASYTPVYGNTASGAIATFDTSLALPLQDCTIDINAVQESGTPTPSSPKLISGFTGANIRVVGANLFDEVMEIGSINTSTGANDTASNVLRSTNYTQIAPNTTYKITQGSYVFAFFYYDVNKTFISYANGSSTFTTPANACYVRFRLYSAYGTTYNNDIAILYPSSLNSYVAYNANSHTTAITWQDEAGTVYGGSLDVTSGVLTVTWGGSDFSTLNWSYNTPNQRWYTNDLASIAKLSYTNPTFKAEQWNTHAWTGASAGDVACNSGGTIVCYTSDSVNSPEGLFVYELATPVTYQLTPTQINTIVGTNNVFTDTNGDTSVVYACSLKDYIDGQ